MVELNVEISDENEFAPTFPVRIAAVNISEEAQVGDEFGIDHCLATDGDSSKYTIKNFSKSFFLSPCCFQQSLTSIKDLGSIPDILFHFGPNWAQCGLVIKCCYTTFLLMQFFCSEKMARKQKQ